MEVYSKNHMANAEKAVELEKGTGSSSKEVRVCPQ